jgi:hypothetical protein
VKRPLVYVAGPITRDPFGCVRQGAAAWERCREAGVVPFIPQLSVLQEMVAPQPYEAWLAYDFDVIRHCEALVRLPGLSTGADREVAFAHELRLPVFHAPEDWPLLKQWAAHLEVTGPFDALRRGELPLADQVTLDGAGIGRPA